MMRWRFQTAALLLVAALTGCGFTSSPADNLTFKAPAGWQGSPGIMGFMQFWRAPNSDDQVLMLFKSPKPLQTRDVFSSANLRDAKVEAQKPITICGNQTAEYFKARGTSRNGRDSNVEMVMTDVSGTTYFAMYLYPAGAAPNGEADAALHELCAK
ncbi:MAG: hypothetical protein JOY69_09875 [Candidatus Eremiobacteraeota bacterium]|nr:hypothetical protein [Candidatus Eremiobacteraeota bacterium]